MNNYEIQESFLKKVVQMYTTFNAESIADDLVVHTTPKSGKRYHFLMVKNYSISISYTTWSQFRNHCEHQLFCCKTHKLTY